MTDPLSTLIAQADQEIERNRILAKIVSAFYWSLVGEGVAPDHAVILAQAWMTTQLMIGASKRDDR